MARGNLVVRDGKKYVRFRSGGDTFEIFFRTGTIACEMAETSEGRVIEVFEIEDMFVDLCRSVAILHRSNSHYRDEDLNASVTFLHTRIVCYGGDVLQRLSP